MRHEGGKLPPAVVLLAGENTRFWPLGRSRHKALYEIGLGKPVLEYVLDGCVRSGVSEMVLVCRPGDSSMAEFLSSREFPIPVGTAVQPEPRGMADAILCGAEELDAETFFVLDGNQIFFADFAEKLYRKGYPSGMALLVRRTDTPERFGVVVPRTRGPRSDDNELLVGEIIEKPKDLSPPQWRIAATYYLRREFLSVLTRHRENSSSGLEAALDEYAKESRIGMCVMSGEHPDVTLKYPWDLLDMHWALMDLVLRTPEKIESPIAPCSIHGGAFVHPTAIVENGVVVERGARIMEYAVVKNYCVVGPGAVVGTHSIVRDYSLLCEKVVVGAQCEVARTILYKGVHLHKNYAGDSIFDEGSSLGAGTVTANRRHDREAIRSVIWKSGEKRGRISTGRTSLGAVVGEKARVGINCSLRPGVKIGSRAGIAEAVVVDRDVQEDEFLKDRPSAYDRS